MAYLLVLDIKITKIDTVSSYQNGENDIPFLSIAPHQHPKYDGRPKKEFPSFNSSRKTTIFSF